MKQELIEGKDYYLNEKGYVVLTSGYLKERGYCCGSGCLNCPYEYEAVPEPGRSFYLEKRKHQNQE